MGPRFRRSILLLTLLGLLVVPGMDRASSVPDEATIRVAGVTNAVGGPTDTSHIRREAVFDGLNLHFTAGRATDTLECNVVTGAAGITFREREDATQGRGFFNVQTDIARGDGKLVPPDLSHDLTMIDPVHCEMSLNAPGGQFHRAGTLVSMRLPVTVRANRRIFPHTPVNRPTDTANEVFEHRYCVDLVADAIPLPPDFTTAAIIGKGLGRIGDCPETKILGRDVTDNVTFGDHG